MHLKKTDIRNPHYRWWVFLNLSFLVVLIFGVPFAIFADEYLKENVINTKQYLILQGIFLGGLMPFLVVPLNIVKRITFYQYEVVVETLKGVRKYPYRKIDYVSREFSRKGCVLKLKLRWKIFGYSLFFDVESTEEILTFLKRKKVRVFRNIWDGLRYEG